MKLQVSGNPDGAGFKLDKDAKPIFTLKPVVGFDLNMLNYFHQRPKTLLSLRNSETMVEVVGYVREFSVKSGLDVKFYCEGKLDLNAVYDLRNSPDPWLISLTDDQKTLDEFFKAAEEKEELKRAGFSEVKVQQLG